MEPSGRNGWQQVANRTAPKRLKQAKTVAVDCDRLPRSQNGKEGVDGSSPSEGFAKAPEIGAFAFTATCFIHNVQRVWSRLWSLQFRRRLSAIGPRSLAPHYRHPRDRPHCLPRRGVQRCAAEDRRERIAAQRSLDFRTCAGDE